MREWLQMETAFQKFHETKGIHQKVRKAAKAKKIRKSSPVDLYTQALEQQIISQEEYDFVKEVNKMAYDVIQVDDFPADSSTSESDEKESRPQQSAEAVLNQ